MKSAFTCMPCKMVTVRIEQDSTTDDTVFRRIIIHGYMEDGSEHEVIFIGAPEMNLIVEEESNESTSIN